MINVGGLCFGLVLGYVTYRMLVRTTANAAISDLSTVVAAIGGGVVTAIAAPGTALFGFYGLGLAIGFAVYGVAYYLANGRTGFARVMGEAPRRSGGEERDFI